MERKNVHSSNLKSIGYNEDKKILEVEFNSGGVYQYNNVPKNIFEELMTASSHGKYFNQMIKEIYSWNKIH